MKTLVFFLALLLSGTSAYGQEKMTADRFREIASAPGDTTPLEPKLAAIFHAWPKMKISIVLTYVSGKVIKEDVTGTSKTVGGKYIVSTVQSKLYKQPMDTISTYDETTSTYKGYSRYGDKVIEATTAYDIDKKTYTSASIYDDFKEVLTGSYSDTEITEHTLAYKSGVLFVTREVRVTPAD